MIITNRIVLNHTMNELNHQISNQTIKYHCTILLQIYVSSIYVSLIDVHTRTVKNEKLHLHLHGLSFNGWLGCSII